MSEQNYLAMSDEDFLKLPEPTTTQEEEAAPAASEPAPVVEVPEVIVEEPVVEAPAQEEPVVTEPIKEGTEEANPEAVTPPVTEPVKAGEEAPVVEEAPVDTQAFYELAMKPFKANGKEFKVNSPEELIRLAQMGAGYGRKMHDLQPALKTIATMEKLGITEADLSLIADIKLGNQEAIKKVIKDSGVDPLDFNPEDPVNYVPTRTSVSDQEFAFKTAVSDLRSNGGGDTVKMINDTWDNGSVDFLYANPALMQVVHEHKQSGVYDTIAAEIDRQRALGNIAHNTPFIHAYHQVGNQLFPEANGDAAPAQVVQQPAPNPAGTQAFIATKVAAPKTPSAPTTPQVKAAAPSKQSAAPAQEKVNPLAMNDEEFLKKYGNRF